MDFLTVSAYIKARRDSHLELSLLKLERKSSGLCTLLTGMFTIKYRYHSLIDHCSFSAALLGLPKLLKEEDIHAEYPSDTDDEYVTERGFQPTLPGEYTKISSALALFRASRILSKVLEQNYPAAATHDLSLQNMSSLDTELNQWSDGLPVHLKLTFAQDKPSTDVTGSRSAILVSYHACKFGDEF